MGSTRRSSRSRFYELAQGIDEQYGQAASPENTVSRLRRGIVRFIGVACSALVLEALIMVIKYSQKELAGFLYCNQYRGSGAADVARRFYATH